MKHCEMGSEFWEAPIGDVRNDIFKDNTVFVLSGRTALDLVARDIIQERKCRSICLPSYCCESMVEPFLRLGLKVKYYDVIPSNDGLHRVIPENHDYNIILLLDYFGFTQTETVEIARQEHDRGTVVIVDQVQSFYSVSDASKYADYMVMSWRKWFFSCAAAARKTFGEWKILPPHKVNSKYIDLRKEAARRKENYLNRDIGEKKLYLEKYEEAESLLETDYADYVADLDSINELQHLHTAGIKKRRQENASAIFKVLSSIDDKRIRPLFPQTNKDDVPLFVPVLIDPLIRTDLRRYLIQNQVYCPIHWPAIKTDGGKELYASELSLLCDQRYTQMDIEREMNLIKEFFAHHA